MIDLNSGSGSKVGPVTISDKVNAAIDTGLQRRRQAELPRHYLGASRLGDPCSRKLCYELSKTPVDPDRELTPKQLRIFATGHALEDAIAAQIDDDALTATFRALAAQWLTDAGFKLVTRNSLGKQFGFEAIDGQLQGHIDGAITASPIPEIETPAGWEHKGINLKAWNKIKKHGVKIANEVYYGQMQVYMAYMNLERFLFTTTNKNTSEMHHEIVTFDPSRAQMLSDKGLDVIRHVQAGHLMERVASNPDFFWCRLCDWRSRCWASE